MPDVKQRAVTGLRVSLAVFAILALPSGWNLSTLSGDEPRYRQPDDRPPLPDLQLKRADIHRYDSERLKLYTDIPADIARPLPPLADQLYDALVETFGPPPPEPDGRPFQVTAFLMKDKKKFLDNQLIHPRIVAFEHGQHLGYQFWMYDQEYDYYRRHLLLHEFTHCFMLAERPDPGRRADLWYLEGMAEVFGTHRLDEQGRLTFGILPASPREVSGLGRIEMVQRAVARGNYHTIQHVRILDAEAFTKSRSDPYAWSWALCQFLASHPRYRERFQKLHLHVTDGAFNATFDELYADDREQLEWEWEWFITDLRYGSDIAAGVIEFETGKPLTDVAKVEVDSARSWQSTGIHLDRGDAFELSATGRITLDATSKPWVSEADGITIDYEAGFPLGRLMGWILPDEPEDLSHERRIAPLSIGSGGSFTASTSGTLYLRVNDHAHARTNNAGRLNVTVQSRDAQ